METGLVSLSVHTTLGGRPLFLLALQGNDANVAATLAGHRLLRIQGGFSGFFSLDHALSACFCRTGEVVIVVTFRNGTEPIEAQRAAGSVRLVVLDACGGRLQDVNIQTLLKHGLELQLAMRRAALGFGRIPGIASSKFDLATVTVLPDLPSDVKVAVELRSANDVTAPSFVPSMEAMQSAARKGGVLTDALKTIKVPLPATVPTSTSKKLLLTSAPQHAQYASECAIASRARLRLLPSHLLSAMRQTAGLGEGGAAGASPLAIEAALYLNEPVVRMQRQQPPTAAAADAAASSHQQPVLEEEEESYYDEEGEEGEFYYDDEEEEDGSYADEEEDGDLGSGEQEADYDEEEEEDMAEEDEEGSEEGGEVIQFPIGSAKSESASSSDVHSSAGPAAASGSASLPPTTSSDTDALVIETKSRPMSSGVAAPLASLQSSLAQLSSSAVSVASAVQTSAPVRSSGGLRIKLACQASEVISITSNAASGGVGAGAVTAITGTLAIRAAPADAPEWPQVAPSTLEFAVTFKVGAPLSSLSVTLAGQGQTATPIDLPYSSAGATAPAAGAPPTPSQVQVSLRLPSSIWAADASAAGGVATPTITPPPPRPAVVDVATLTYTIAPSCQPPLLRVQAVSRNSFAPVAPTSAPTEGAPDAASEGQQQHQHQQHKVVEIVLKSVLHPTLKLPVASAQFLLQLPLQPLQPGAVPGSLHADSAPQYGSPQYKPAGGQWNAARSQLLWSVAPAADPAAAAAAASASTTTSSGSADPSDIPRVTTYCQPGVPAEFKARVPVLHGVSVPGPEGSVAPNLQGPLLLPVQVRLAFGAGTLVPVALAPNSSGASAVQVVSLVGRSQSRLQATVRD